MWWLRVSSRRQTRPQASMWAWYLEFEWWYHLPARLKRWRRHRSPRTWATSSGAAWGSQQPGTFTGGPTSTPPLLRKCTRACPQTTQSPWLILGQRGCMTTLIGPTRLLRLPQGQGWYQLLSGFRLRQDHRSTASCPHSSTQSSLSQVSPVLPPAIGVCIGCLPGCSVAKVCIARLRIVPCADLPHAGHVKLVSITGLAGGGLDVAFDAIFTNVTAPATRRRQLLHTAQDADNLAHALVDNIRSVFSSQVFGAFGVPQVPAGYSVRNTHYTTTTAYHEVYPADHYTSYDFMQPSIYSEEGSGSQFDSASSYYDSYDPYYGSDSLEPFSPETLIVSFLVHLPGFTSDDWWNIGPDFIQIVSRAIGGSINVLPQPQFISSTYMTCMKRPRRRRSLTRQGERFL